MMKLKIFIYFITLSVFGALFSLLGCTTSEDDSNSEGCSPVSDVVEDMSHLTLIGSKTFGTEGGRLLLENAHDDVRWFRIDIPSGALSCEQEIKVYLSSQQENTPLNFTRISPLIEIRPRGLTFNSDIIVILPYDDEDQNGVVDGTTYSENEIIPGYYSVDYSAWGPQKATVPDTTVNVAGFYTSILAPFALWGTDTGSGIEFQGENAGMYVIVNDFIEEFEGSWDETTVTDILDSKNIRKLFIHVYSPSSTATGQGVLECESDGNTSPSGITGTNDYFSLSLMITQADLKNIEVIPVLTLFDYAQPDDEDHKQHVLNVLDYFISNYTGLDGFLLDFVRFTDIGTTLSFNNIQLVTNFVKEIKDNHSGGLPVYLSVLSYMSTYREKAIGQRLADLASVSDYHCPMLYGTDKSSDDILSFVRQHSLPRNVNNNLKIIPILDTYGDITSTQLSQKLSGSLEARSDGIGFFRLDTTTADEWTAIDGKIAD